jgi:hypothetical protein
MDRTGRTEVGKTGYQADDGPALIDFKGPQAEQVVEGPNRQVAVAERSCTGGVEDLAGLGPSPLQALQGPSHASNRSS